MSDVTGAAAPSRVVWRVRGNPSDADLAAVVVALSRPVPAAARPQTTDSAWSDRAAGLRGPLAVGADGWRRSGLPGR